MLIFMLFRENMRNDGPMQSFIPKDDMLKEPTHTRRGNFPINYVLDATMNILSIGSWHLVVYSKGIRHHCVCMIIQYYT